MSTSIRIISFGRILVTCSLWWMHIAIRDSFKKQTLSLSFEWFLTTSR